MSFDVRFKTPCNIILTGPTQSGKSTFIRKLIFWRRLLFAPVPEKVFYVYAARDPLIDKMIEKGQIHKAIKNLPKDYNTLEKMVTKYKKEGVLLIVDDGLSQLEKYLPTVFEELTHRANTTILFVSQVMFLNSSLWRRLSLNTHYMIAFRNKRNSLQIRALASQFSQCNPRFVSNSFIDATKPKPTIKLDENDENSAFGYGYIILNFNPMSPEILSLVTNILPTDKDPVAVYKEMD